MPRGKRKALPEDSSDTSSDEDIGYQSKPRLSKRKPAVAGEYAPITSESCETGSVSSTAEKDPDCSWRYPIETASRTIIINIGHELSSCKYLVEKYSEKRLLSLAEVFTVPESLIAGADGLQELIEYRAIARPNNEVTFKVENPAREERPAADVDTQQPASTSEQLSGDHCQMQNSESVAQNAVTNWQPTLSLGYVLPQVFAEFLRFERERRIGSSKWSNEQLEGYYDIIQPQDILIGIASFAETYGLRDFHDHAIDCLFETESNGAWAQGTCAASIAVDLIKSQTRCDKVINSLVAMWVFRGLTGTSFDADFLLVPGVIKVYQSQVKLVLAANKGRTLASGRWTHPPVKNYYLK